MSKKAEEAAIKAYPISENSTSGVYTMDNNYWPRLNFIQGYEQAEKDLALTWEDIRTIVQILTQGDWYDFEISDKLWSKEFYEEILQQFKKQKEKE